MKREKTKQPEKRTGKTADVKIRAQKDKGQKQSSEYPAATEAVKPRTARGLANEGTIASYDKER